MKKLMFLPILMIVLLLVSCVNQEDSDTNNTGVSEILKLSELTGGYEIEDLSALGFWVLTIDHEHLERRLKGTAYTFRMENGVFDVKPNPLNKGQLLVFLPEFTDAEKIEEGTVSKAKEMVSFRNGDEIAIEYIWLTKANKLYEMTLVDYIFMKKAQDEMVYDDEKLLRPTHVKSSDGYVYTMKRYYDARQVSDDHSVNGAFSFLKGLSNHESFLETDNPNRVKIENGSPVISDPDMRNRVWQLGKMGSIDESATYTYDILDNSGEQILILTIKDTNLPGKYKQSGVYEIQLKGDATVCSFVNRSGSLYDCVIEYATTNSMDLVKNARFSEIIYSTETDIRVKPGNEAAVQIITDPATVLKVASGTTVAQVKTYLEAVDGSDQTYTFKITEGELTDTSTLTTDGTLTVRSSYGEPYKKELEMRVNANPFVRLEKTDDTIGWHDSIQAAINAGDDGATITVWPGEYKEAIDMSQNSNNYHIRSINPMDSETRDRTIVNANGVLANDGTALKDVLSISNGQTEKTIIEGLTLTSRMAKETAGQLGVFILDATPEIRNCKISGNSGSMYGGGIYIQTDGLVNPANIPYIHHNLIEDNYACAGGGIFVYTDSEAKIVENEIRNNLAMAKGAGISVEEGSRIRNDAGDAWLPHLLPGTARNAVEVEGTTTTNTYMNNQIKNNPESDAADIFFETTMLLDSQVIVHGGEKWARVYTTLNDGDIARLFTNETDLTEVASAVYTVQPMSSRLGMTYVQIDHPQIQTGTTYYVTLQSTPAFYAQSAKVATDAIAGPSAPTLSSPANTLVDVSVAPILEWTASDRAETYRIYMGTDSGNLTKVAGDISDTQYATTGLAGLTDYYWQVESVDLYGATALSVEWRFTTEENVIEDGTSEHPFMIDSIEELAKIGSGTDGWTLEKCYKLNRDLDFNADSSYEDASANKMTYTTGSGWDPIGFEDGDWDGADYFKGSFNGNGYTIKNLMINRAPANGNVGFFGVVGGGVNTEVKNLTVDGIVITCSEYYVGGLIGAVDFGATVTNCAVKNVTLNVGTYSGGLLGSLGKGVIKYCSAINVDITGISSLGGLIGMVWDYSDNRVYVDYSCSTGVIKPTKGTYGGLIGETYKTTVNGCFAAVDIQPTGSGYQTFGGGLVGKLTEDSVLKNAYALGDTGGNHYAYGGLVGSCINSAISNCYTTGNVTISNTDNVNNVAGLVGSLNTGSAVSNSIAFNLLVTAGNYYDDDKGRATTNRVVGGTGTGITISGCYANSSMVVKWEGVNESFSKGTTTVDGADISNLTSTTSAPMSGWEFESDSNGDFVYWKLESGANRPVLYVDPEKDGQFVKLGTDDGM